MQNSVWQLNPAAFILAENRSLSRADLWNQAWLWAQNLPAKPVVINLFQDRAKFICCLMAVALRQGTTILPPDTAEQTLQALQSQHQAWLAADFELPARLQTAEISSLNWQLNSEIAAQPIDFAPVFDAQIWLFTSGSTGEPKKVSKSWSEMLLLAQQAVASLQIQPDLTFISTVPSQHMFGLETSVFWPLIAGVKIWQFQVFYPADIEKLMLELSGKKLLISTPLHLKTLAEFELEKLQIQQIVSATAAMSFELSSSLIQKFNAQVFEVLGSTETASFAVRQHQIPANENWKLYRNNRFVVTKTGQPGLVNEDLQTVQEIADLIEIFDPQTFKLVGRRKDLIKIAGKRQSFMQLNNCLQSCVADGVFIWSEQQDRLEALVVSDLNPQQIRQALADKIDQVFMPRKIHYLQKLPRNKLGKIQRQALDDLITKLRSQ